MRRRDVVLQGVANDAILLDQQQGKAHVLNAAAVYVWELIDGSTSVPQIAATFGARYGLPVDAVYEDVVVILDTLRELDLLA
jgi:hypothetical protein